MQLVLKEYVTCTRREECEEGNKGLRGRNEIHITEEKKDDGWKYNVQFVLRGEIICIRWYINM